METLWFHCFPFWANTSLLLALQLWFELRHPFASWAGYPGSPLLPIPIFQFPTSSEIPSFSVSHASVHWEPSWVCRPSLPVPLFQTRSSLSSGTDTFQPQLTHPSEDPHQFLVLRISCFSWYKSKTLRVEFSIKLDSLEHHDGALVTETPEDIVLIQQFHSMALHPACCKCYIVRLKCPGGRGGSAAMDGFANLFT